jgi:hypothetical protein
MKKLDDIRKPGNTRKLVRRVQSSRPVDESQAIPQIKRLGRSVRPGRILNFFRWLIHLVKGKRIVFVSLGLIVLIGVVSTLLMEAEIFDFSGSEIESEIGVSRAEDLKKIVIKEDTKLAVDFSFNLKMIINSQAQAIPANYGKNEDEKMIFSTDTSNGDVRVQLPEKMSFILNDFFVLWGSKFNKNCLLNHCLGGTGSLKMTVNGAPNSKFNNYVIQQDDQIVITYTD